MSVHELITINMLIRSAVILGILASCAYAGFIPFRDCQDTPTIGRVRSVDFYGCDSTSFSQPCQIQKGSTAEGMVVYQAGRGAESLRCKIYGEYGGLPPIPFPGDCPNVDACSDMVYQNSTAPDEDGLCPVETGEVLHYKLSIYIDPSYPQTTIIGKWTLRDEFDEVMMCLEINVQIVA